METLSTAGARHQRELIRDLWRLVDRLENVQNRALRGDRMTAPQAARHLGMPLDEVRPFLHQLADEIIVNPKIEKGGCRR